MYSHYKIISGGEGGSWGPPPENIRKCRMQEKPSSTFLRLILYIFFFVNQFSSFFSTIL